MSPPAGTLAPGGRHDGNCWGRDQPGPRGVRRVAGREAPRGAGPGPARPQLAVRRRARSTWCCATATCWSCARSRPAAAWTSARRTRRSTPAKARAAAPAGRRCWREEHGVRPVEVRIDLVAVLRPAPGSLGRRARAGAGLMAVATARTVSLQRGDRPPDRRAGRRLAGAWSATTLVGRPDASLNEARDRCRMAITNSGLDWPATRRITILLSPADLPKRGTHFDLAIAVAVLGASGAGAGRLPCEDSRLHRRARPSTAACARCPACCRWCWPPRRAGIRRVVVPEPQARRGGDGARHGGARACGRSPRWSPSSAARRCPRRRRWRRCPAAACSPGGARSGCEELDLRRPARAWPTPATPSRSPPRAATTCCSSGPKGAGKTSSPSGSRGSCPT